MMMMDDNMDEVIYLSNNEEVDDKEKDDEAFARKFKSMDANVRAKRHHKCTMLQVGLNFLSKNRIIS